MPNRANAVAAILLLSLAGCASREVAFTVLAPLETPRDATVLVRGAHPAFAEGLPLQYAADAGYVGTFSFPPGQALTFNLALRVGDGELPELSQTLEPVPPRPLPIAEGQYQDVLTEVARWRTPADPARPAVTFEVTVPASHPVGSPVWVTGNLPELGAWNPKGLRLYKRADGKFVGQVQVPANSPLEYALTRGSWSTSERLATGEEAPNRNLTVGSQAQTVPLTVGGWLTADKSKVLTGNIEYLRSVSSVHVSARDVIVWLPPGYHDEGNTLRYPVLYLHDGQNLMDGSTSFAGEWHLDEIAQRLVQLGQLEPVILVGVYNVGSDRIADYTHVPDAQHGGGGAAAYASFLVDELKPRVDVTFRTRTDAASTGVGGSSLGGLVSLYLGLTHSETFQRLGVVSPSLWWADREILGRVRALEAKLPFRIWLDMGTQEGNPPQENVDNARALRDALISEGWSLEQDLHYLEAAGAVHNEASWGARADSILRALYPPP
ncbi:MAG: alpha/beta hydrolase-fold protein [Myxococcota bacterium]|nr:alpha/beta hydrolase-fold protein [Myxococcota bacterium]